MTPDDPRRLEILLADYTASREDERGFLAVQATLVSLILAALSFLIVALTNDCRFGAGSTPGCTPQTSDVVLASMSLVPLALLSYLQALATAATIRSFYMRALEHEIRTYVSASAEDSDKRVVLPMSYIEIITAIGTLARGRGAIRILLGVLVTTGGIVLIGVTVAAGLLVSTPLKLTMLLVYGLGTTLIVREAVAATVRGREYFRVAVTEAARRMARPEGDDRREDGEAPGRRALWSYLVLPRPDDLIKAAFFPVTLVYGIASSVSTRGDLEAFDVSRAVVFWIALELLIYSARYQWNDIRGAIDDEGHPLARGRLPFDRRDESSFRAAARASIVVMVVRLYVVAIIASVAWWDLALPLLTTVVAVFGLAVLYEYLRSLDSERHPAALAWMIYVVVGWGYAIRGAAALWVLGIWSLGSMPEPGITLWLVVFLASYGSMFVVLTWILDAASYCSESLDDVAAGAVRHSRELDRKPHLKYLLTRSGYDLEPMDGEPSREPFAIGGADSKFPVAPRVVDVTVGSLSKPLAQGDRRVTPQLLVTAIAVAASVAAGVVAAGLSYACLGFAVLGALVGVILSLVGAGARVLVALGTIAAATLTAFAYTGSGESALTIAVPFALCVGTAVIFRAQRYVDLKYGMAVVAAGAKKVTYALTAAIFGRNVIGAFQKPPPAPRESSQV